MNSRHILYTAGIAVIASALLVFVVHKRDRAVEGANAISGIVGVNAYVALMRDQQAHHGRPVMIGDSITQAFDEDALGRKVLNLGVSGIRTDEILSRVGGWHSLESAPLVILMAGTNDIFQHREAGMESRYRELLAALKSPVIIMSSAPPFADAKMDHQSIIASAEAREACASDHRCSFVDLNSLLRWSMRKGVRVLQPDGIHLSASGYTVWADALKQALLKTPVSGKSPSRSS